MGAFDTHIPIKVISLNSLTLTLIVLDDNIFVHNEIICIYIFDCADHLFLCDVISVVNDIFPEAGVKKDWLLADCTDWFSQVMNVEILDVNAINQNLSLDWVMESEDHFKDGRLATSWLANEGNFFSFGQI